MANPTVLDFDALLAPISPEQPSGAELKSDPTNNAVYYAVKDRATGARAAERLLLTAESDAAQSLDPPDWEGVRSKCLDAITRHSKDVWFAAWLIEAMCRLEGFAGLRDGFRLVREMCEKYWDGIHPQPDDDGYATPMAQLRGLNGDEAEGALLRPIDAIPLTRSATHGSLGMADFRQAADLQQIADSARRQARIDQGAITLETFDKAVRESPAEFYRNLYEDIEQSIEQFRLMTELLDQRCGRDEYGEPTAPPSSNIRQALEACRDRVKAVARHVLEAAVPGRCVGRRRRRDDCRIRRRGTGIWRTRTRETGDPRRRLERLAPGRRLFSPDRTALAGFILAGTVSPLGADVVAGIDGRADPR